MKHQRKNLNITLWVGYFIVLIGMLSYRPFFVQFPITRDIPWVNMLMFVVGIGLMGGGLKRAFQRPDIYRGKVAGTIVAIAGVAGISYFFLRVYVAGLQKPI